jgi:hypothetical protein
MPEHHVTRRGDHFWVCQGCGRRYSNVAAALQCEARGAYRSFDYQVGDWVALGYDQQRALRRVLDIEDRQQDGHITIVTLECPNGKTMEFIDERDREYAIHPADEVTIDQYLFAAREARRQMRNKEATA